MYTHGRQTWHGWVNSFRSLQSDTEFTATFRPCCFTAVKSFFRPYVCPDINYKQIEMFWVSLGGVVRMLWTVYTTTGPRHTSADYQPQILIRNTLAPADCRVAVASGDERSCIYFPVLLPFKLRLGECRKAIFFVFTVDKNSVSFSKIFTESVTFHSM